MQVAIGFYVDNSKIKLITFFLTFFQLMPPSVKIVAFFVQSLNGMFFTFASDNTAEWQQMVAHLAHNQEVEGSSPFSATYSNQVKRLFSG